MNYILINEKIPLVFEVQLGEKNLTLFVKLRLSKHPYQCSHFTDDGTEFQKS